METESTSPQIVEGQFQLEEVTQLAKTDLNFLAALAAPGIFRYFFPAVFISIWNWVLSALVKLRDFSQLAIGLPRGFGKTFVVKLIVLYAILFTKKRFILVISEIEAKAVSILRDIEDMLNEPNVKAAFGDWSVGIQVNNQTVKIFGFRGREIILKAAGAGTGIRGITEKNLRPDLMIFEDIQSREDSESEVLSDKLESWMYSTAMKAKSPEGCLFLFIANMYPTKGSLLRRIKRNPNWIKYIVGGITADGKSLWEELQPLQQLLKEYLNDLASGHPEAFYAEVLNDENASVNHLVDISKIPPYPYSKDDISYGTYIIIDPATDKAHADEVSIGAFRIFDGRPACVKIIEGRFSPLDTIKESIKLAFEVGARVICVESNAYQYSLLFWFEWLCTNQGITGFHFLDLYSGRASKNSRIVKMFTMLTGQNPDILLAPEVRDQAFNQIIPFNPLKTDNTDGILDLLTYAPKAIELYGPLIVASSNIIEAEEFDSIAVIEHNSPF